MKRGESHTWLSARIPCTTSWDQLPGTRKVGAPGLFKMLHVIALR
jgi:hypothetical protein